MDMSHLICQQHGIVLSGRTVAVPYEWSTGSALHYSHIVAACPHVLQVLNVLPVRTSYMPIMALMSGALETYVCALGTYEPSCTSRPAMLFFMFEARSLQKTAGHVVAVL
jgi:hypothetical protein